MAADPDRDGAGVSRTGEAGDFPGLDGVGGAAGIAAAVAAAGPMLPLREVEQLALPVGEVIDQREVREAPRGRGRPPGAPNRRTAAVRDYLLSRYAHPLEVLAQTYSRPADVLAAELGCSKLEAVALQVRCAVELSPYVEGKMPVAIDVRAKSDVVLVMTAPGAAAAVAATINADGMEAVDWASAEVSPASPGMAEFRHLEAGE